MTSIQTTPSGATRRDTSSKGGYARARLWLGITGVGTFVTLAALALAGGLPERLGPAGGLGGEVLTLLAFVLLYALLHLPFDLLGGYALPRRHWREHPDLPVYLRRLARGAGAHAGVLFALAALILLAARVGGLAGVIAVGVAAPVALLGARTAVARLYASIEPSGAGSTRDDDAERPPTRFLSSNDEGFTGGVSGILSPRRILLPERWKRELSERGLRIAEQRRRLAVSSGAWRRGRIAALLFTWGGVVVSAMLVGGDALAHAYGVIEFSLFFTLWSFLGLLTLPTLSRAGVAEVDAKLRAAHADDDEIDAVIGRLDWLQDDEPQRSALVESIFHPIPSVNRRVEGRSSGLPACWDAARTTVYLSAAGLGLLGRAVHCNSGRPALWAYLPVD